MFDSTKGGESANSYASVIDADDYFEFDYSASEWADIDEDGKEKLLVTATRMIDTITPLYEKDDSTQALNFPIDPESDVDSNGDLLGDGYDQAKEACFKQAYYIYQNTDAIDEGVTGAIQGLKSETIGPTSKTVTGFNQMQRYAPGVLALLSEWLALEFMTYRG